MTYWEKIQTILHEEAAHFHVRTVHVLGPDMDRKSQRARICAAARMKDEMGLSNRKIAAILKRDRSTIVSNVKSGRACIAAGRPFYQHLPTNVRVNGRFTPHSLHPSTDGL